MDKKNRKSVSTDKIILVKLLLKILENGERVTANNLTRRSRDGDFWNTITSTH